MPNLAPIPTADVAALLGKDVRTIHRWVSLGVLTPIAKTPGLRGAYLFNRSDVETLRESLARELNVQGKPRERAS